MPKRVTQRDVARHASVSQATVSLVMSGGGQSIPVETLERVRASARELGYLPNRYAQALKTNQTRTVACIVPDIANPFYPPLVRGVEAVMEKAGYDTIVVNTDGTDERERRFLEWSLQRQVDGVVGVFFTLRAPEFRDLIESGAAVARIESSIKHGGALPIDDFYIDNHAAAAAVTRYLIDRGHRSIAMVTARGGPEKVRSGGYAAAMRDAGLAPSVLVGETYTEEEGRALARTLLSAPKRPTAIIGGDDLLAIGAMQAIRESRLSIPGDVAVAGFDDIFPARLVTPGLTTVSLFQFDVGVAAAKALLQRLKGGLGDAGATHEMSFRLIERDST